MVEDVDDEFDRRDYPRVFDLRNLCGDIRWDKAEARDAADLMIRFLGPGDRLVLLGTRVRRAFGVPETRVGTPHVAGGVRLYPVPHPSGLCRAYNDPAVRRAVGLLLSNLWRVSHAELRRPAEDARGLG
jgi:hypothetical protein